MFRLQYFSIFVTSLNGSYSLISSFTLLYASIDLLLTWLQHGYKDFTNYAANIFFQCFLAIENSPLREQHNLRRTEAI